MLFASVRIDKAVFFVCWLPVYALMKLCFCMLVASVRIDKAVFMYAGCQCTH